MTTATLIAPHRAPAAAPTPFPASAAPLVPRDLVVRVGKYAGFAVYYENGTPFYKERGQSPEGRPYEIEVEFLLPHIAFRIMNRAPHLALNREAAGYTCALKRGQMAQRGATLVEAVFRAFVDAKAAATPAVQ